MATMTTFVATMVRERKRSNLLGGVFLRDLDGAVGLLWFEPVRGRARKAAMAEVELRTRGCDFRLDCSDGPLFLEEALWRYAGRPWSDLSPDDDKHAPHSPVWPTTGRATVAA